MLEISTEGRAAPERTKADFLEDAKGLINQTILMLYFQIQEGLTTVQTTILQNPNGLAKEEVREYYGAGIEAVDLLGEKAMELLSFVKIKDKESI